MTIKSASISVAEILRKLALSILPAATLLALNAANAQDATNIPRPNIGWSPGAVCADDYALTFINGQLRCVDSVARAGQATTATTAGTAQQLDPNATVSASQISGSLTAEQIQTPTCGAGEVLTNTGAGMKCVAGSSAAVQATCGAGTVTVRRYFYCPFVSSSGSEMDSPQTFAVPGGTQNQSYPIAGSFPDDNPPTPTLNFFINYQCQADGKWHSVTQQPVYSLAGQCGSTANWTPTEF